MSDQETTIVHSRKYWRAVGIIAAALIVISATTFLVLHKPEARIVIPKCVLLADFQSPLDRDLIKPFSDFDNTEISHKLDSTVIKPLLDDTRTINITMSAVEITKEQFRDRPDLIKIIQDCAKVVGIKQPRVFVADGQGVNAHTTNVTDPTIVLNSSLLSNWYISEGELRFIIGHEMGHIKCAHVKWHTVLDIARDTLPEKIATVALFPLLKWFRESEFSADNAGLLCCQDVRTAESALIRMELGLGATTTGRINIDEYLRQREKSNFGAVAEGVQLWREVLSGHPFTPDRIRQVRIYAGSDRYRTIWER